MIIFTVGGGINGSVDIGSESSTLNGWDKISPSAFYSANLKCVHSLACLRRVQSEGSLATSIVPEVLGVRIDFISGISAHHMLDSFVTARMKLEPRINLQDFVIDYDYGPSIGDESFNFPPGVDGFPSQR